MSETGTALDPLGSFDSCSQSHTVAVVAAVVVAAGLSSLTEAAMIASAVNDQLCPGSRRNHYRWPIAHSFGLLLALAVAGSFATVARLGRC